MLCEWKVAMKVKLPPIEMSKTKIFPTVVQTLQWAIYFYLANVQKYFFAKV